MPFTNMPMGALLMKALRRASLARSSASARFCGVMSTWKPPIWPMLPSPARIGKRITMLQL